MDGGDAAAGPRLQAVRDGLAQLAASDEAGLTSARAVVCDALHALLLDVATRDVPEDARRLIDSALAPEATALRGALLKALRVCALHRGLLGLPALLEQTRILLAGAPHKGVATYLEVDLVADVRAADDARALSCVPQVLAHMTGVGRLKKDLGGVELSAPARKSCRTASNAAEKALGALEAQQQQQRAREAGRAKPVIHEPERGARRPRIPPSTVPAPTHLVPALARRARPVSQPLAPLRFARSTIFARPGRRAGRGRRGAGGARGGGCGRD